MALPLPVMASQLETIKLPCLTSVWVSCPRPIGTFKEFYKRITGQELSEEDWQIFSNLLKKTPREKCSGLPDDCSMCAYFEKAIPPEKTL